MYEIQLEQEINARPSRVWEVLTSFREYDEWNPTITRMRATLSVGAPVSFVIAVGGRELKIAAEMLRVEVGQELCWRGPTSWLLSMAFSGEHYFRLEPSGADGTRLIHGEKFSGRALPDLWGKLKGDLEKAYGNLNQALKRRAEAGQGPRAA
jgi:hypothetical protein